MALEFRSRLLQAPGMNATGIPVPDDVVAGLGGPKNPKVTAEVRSADGDGAWFTYRNSITTRGGSYIMSFSSAHRDASGLRAGDEVEVRVELDTAPRTLELPEDLTSALTAAGGLDSFLAMSNSKQRGYVDPLIAAKAQETRQRKIDKIVAEFGS